MTLPTQTSKTGGVETAWAPALPQTCAEYWRGRGQGHAWATVVPGVGHLASLGVCSPLRRLTPGRAPLGRGMQGSASEPATPPGRAPREGGTVPPRARRRVAQSLSHKVEGSERAPRAYWPSGSGAGATPQRVELRSIGVTGAGCRPERSGRGAWRAPHGTGAVGRVCLWTRRAPWSLGPRRLPFRSRCQALQAALSPPPRAFSPVRSRARAARGAGRRRREQPVV